jgi:hypothetical protein
MRCVLLAHGVINLVHKQPAGERFPDKSVSTRFQYQSAKLILAFG